MDIICLFLGLSEAEDGTNVADFLANSFSALLQKENVRPDPVCVTLP